MDLGSGIALGSLILSFGMVAFKAVPKKNGNQVVNNGKCPAHQAIETRLSEGDERMDTICKKTAAIGKVVIAIAAHQKVPIDEIRTEMQELML